MWGLRVKILLLFAAISLHQSAPTQHQSGLQKRNDQPSPLPLTSSCPDLVPPSNGYREPQESDHKIGTLVSFGCNDGYELQGPSQLTCTQNTETGEASWSADPPQCIALTSQPLHSPPVSCGTPPDPTLNAHIFALFPGVQVQYACNFGYRRSSGNQVLVCSNGIWIGTPLYCTREHCLDLGDISQGVRILSGTEPGDVVAFRCNEGYSLLGERQLTCGQDGEWSDVWPRCITEPPQCGDPGIPLNGGRVVHGTTEGKRVEFFCNDGYELEGDGERVCLSTGEWKGSVPTCTELACGPPQDIAHGYVNFNATVFSSRATYSCEQGFFLAGYDPVSVCSAGARWIPPPPTCEVIRCPTLRHPSHGRVRVLRYPSYGMVAGYTCNPGFGLLGVPVRTCQGDGTWSSSRPSCQRGSCGTLPDPENGVVRFTSLLLGGHATFECNEGYVLDGTFRRTCGVEGVWSGTSPTCKPVECPNLVNPGNGTVVMSNSNLFGSVANYSCNFGYMLYGSESRECQSTGLWTGGPPGCFGIRCPGLEAPHNGKVQFSDTIIGSEASYSCEVGYQLKFGDVIRTCTAEQEWLGSSPCCIFSEILCPNLTSPLNGSVTFDTQLGNMAEYSCDAGFVLVGEGQRLCQASGEWSGEEPVCGLQCPNLPDPGNGTVSQNGNDPGSEACYTCTTGFIPSSSTCRECLTSGEWSGMEVTCISLVTSVTTSSSSTPVIGDPADCFALPDPANGTVDISEGTLSGARAFYSCDRGFVSTGPDVRVCGIDGLWNGTEPECNLVSCGSLPDPENGSVDLSDGVVFGSTAVYTCTDQQLFTLEGDANRTCLISGVWSGAEPTCNSRECEELLAPANTTITFSNQNFIESVAEYSCDNGFVLVNGSVRTCTVSGWTPEAPICRELQCPSLLNPMNGTVSVTSLSVGGVATYSCDEGYVLSSNVAERTCESDGSWSGMDPTCILIACPALLDPLGGSVEVSGLTPGNTATYSCDIGFELQGNESTRECGPDGEWEGVEPVCQAVTFCPELTDPANGVVDVRGMTVGSQAIYECVEGFAAKGPVVRMCGEDGEWEGEETECVDISTISCPALPNPVDGMVDILSNDFRGGALYSCNDGFSAVGSILRVCTACGEWSEQPPTCEADSDTISCPVLTAPANGEIAIASTVAGSEVTYTCNSGHTLDGPATRTCQNNGNWTGEDPLCIPMDCGPLDNPVNGVVTLEGGTTVGNIATYTCDPGFVRVGEFIRVCQFNGMWSQTPPTCEFDTNAVSCPNLTAPQNGEIAIDSTVAGSEVTYTCNSGHTLDGPATRTCQNNGNWTGEDPLCIPMDCGALDNPVDGVVTLEGGTTVGNIATYTCDPGFVRDGAFLRVCQFNGMWSGTLPTCRFVDCGILSDPVNGMVDISSGTFFGATAEYTCVVGFEVVGASTRTCTSDGVWSDSKPTCQLNVKSPIKCPVLSDPLHGTLKLVGDGGEGSVAKFSCDNGFGLKGEQFLLCGADGEWDFPPPTCEKIQCPDPGVPRNGRRIVLGDFSQGSRVYFLPRDGFEIETGGKSVILCRGNGNWSFDTPTFIASDEPSCTSSFTFDKFGRLCKCSSNGTLEDCCRYRRNWSSLSRLERERYISAVLTVSSDPKYTPLYQTLLTKYQDSFHTVAQTTIPEISQFIPWHRYFLLEYEDLLRLVHTDITIPYWDWTTFTSTPYSAPVFNPTSGFGDSADPVTGCVASGPFREGEFEVTYLNRSSGCLTRDYNDYTFFKREYLQGTLSLGTDLFNEFHNFVQLFLSLNIRCFVGGQMCTTNAASDPLLLLHLARIDLFVQKWQERAKNNDVVQQSNKADRLVLTLDPDITVADFCSNSDLPYDVCVRYAPLDPVGAASQEGSGGSGSSDMNSAECVPEDRLVEGAGSLSDQARQYLASMCSNIV